MDETETLPYKIKKLYWFDCPYTLPGFSMLREPTRTEDLMQAIRQKVASRAISPGDRLPSVRSFAETMGVSPSTVVEAYDRLVAEGLIRARRGSGFYLTGSAMPPIPIGEMEPRRDRAIDPFWVSRQSLDTDADVLKPGCGWLPADWLPQDAIRRGLRALARTDDDTLANYGGTRGSLALRRHLLSRFAEEGLEAGSDQLMLTGSGTQAVDLVCRYLLRPGDVVLVDDPGYFNFQALLRAHHVRIIGVPYTPTGPDPAVFEALLAAEHPRLYITNSALHNPTGASLSPQTAHRLLSAAALHDLTIIEDDIFTDFEPTPSPRLAVLDGFERVIRVGSFSKSLSAAARCGYIAARADWIEGLVDLQVATNFGGPSPMATELIAGILSGGGYRRHMAELRQRLTHAREDLVRRLAPLGITPWVMPRGGFYLWCHLPDGHDSADVARFCMAQDIVLAPGNVFSASQSAAGFMRFNVTQTRDERIFAALAASLKG